MREILFRGKRLDNGEWVEGFYVERQGKQWIYPSGDPVISRSLARELRPMHSAKSTQKIMREGVPVDPATVGQYTGMKDKNGKRIFEGDVVEGHCHSAWSHYLQRCEVAYGRDGFEARHHVNCGDDGWRYYTYRVLFSKDVVVIGNIHDNPELLEVGEG